MKTIPELLAPAGDLEKMKYAFEYGADAVYAGIPKFSLRARENGFRDESIAEAVEYAHRLSKRIYLTLNIFPHNIKLKSFRQSLKWMTELKPDALIISDPGVILMARELCPDIPIHLSTQANTVNWAAVKFWQQVGVRRIILSRELSIKEISEIRQQVPDIELEAFVHGAICIAYSGRCLLSNYFNHRDPNQGTCTNSCRWEYKILEEKKAHETDYRPLSGSYYLEESKRPGELFAIDEDENGAYIMNSKDLCAISLLEEMREAGIDSFKIEGRTKSVYYLSVITRAYRKAIDDLIIGKPFDPRLETEVKSIANRGYITGFLERNPKHEGVNYSSSQSDKQTHLFCGIVKEDANTPAGFTRITVHNRIEIGDQLEVITKNGTIPVILQNMLSLEGESIECAHGGAGDIFIKLPGIIPSMTLVRKCVMQPSKLISLKIT